MAHLVQVRVENFRAFRNASFDVPVSGLLLVAGQNNSGKSALLSALDTVSGNTSTVGIRYANSIEPARVWARFALEDGARARVLGDSDTQWLRTCAAKWVEWEFVEFENAMVLRQIYVAWPDDDANETPLTVAQLRLNSAGDWQLTHKGSPLFQHFDQPLASPNLFGRVPELSSLMRVDNNAVKAAASALSAWRSGFFHFRPLRQTPYRKAVLSSVDRLDSGGVNLAEVLHHLHSNEPQAWQTICQLVQQVVPGVGALMLPSEGSEFSIAFADQHFPRVRHNLKDLGTGVEQILMTLVAGLTEDAQTVVLEEPETGLHPSAQRALLSLLQEWSGSGRVFALSTHSSVMLDWGSSAVLAVAKQGVSSVVEVVKDDPADLLRDLGIRFSDYLSAHRILLLEGPSDEQMMNTWFPALVRNPALVIIPGEGGDDARRVDLMATWLDRADALGGRRVLFVRDRDELSADQLKRLENSDQVFVLPCREIENFLLDFEAVASTLATIFGVLVTAPQVEAQAKVLAESLKEEIVMKRVCWALGAHRHVDHRLRGKLAKQKADKAQLTKTVVERLPKRNEIENQIDSLWVANAEDVDSRWDRDWLALVPGSDLLDLLWHHFAGRRYNKTEHGLLIAQHMRTPPAALSEVLDNFMAE